MTTTLILGGTGFVSSACARAALAQNHTTYLLTRGQRPLPPGLANSLPLTADRNDYSGFATALASPTLPATFDLVIDCIAFTPDHAGQDLDTFFPESAAPRAKHLIVLSSDFVPSALNRPLYIDETYDRFDENPYAAGKRAIEEILLHAAHERRLPITLLRPCHIYGPGGLLGLLPLHGRDPRLLDRIKNHEPLKLLANGLFLQHPLFIDDLTALLLAIPANPHTHGQLYFAAGPDIIESRTFYTTLADLLGTTAHIEEAPITPYLNEHPDHLPFCCHRLYHLDKLKAHGLPLPATPLREGLQKTLASLTSAQPR